MDLQPVTIRGEVWRPFVCTFGRQPHQQRFTVYAHDERHVEVLLGPMRLRAHQVEPLKAEERAVA